MARVTSLGKWQNDFVKQIYGRNRKIVDRLVAEGKIPADQADVEWAKLVAADLAKSDLKIPERIANLIGSA